MGDTEKAILGAVNLKGRTPAHTLWESVADRVALSGLIEGGFLTMTGNLTSGHVRPTPAGRALAERMWA